MSTRDGLRDIASRMRKEAAVFPDMKAKVNAMEFWAGEIEKATALDAPYCSEPNVGALRGSGQAGAAEELFQAANTAAMNLATSMNLKEHPASCECYGCRLTRAVINFALARAKETVRPIVERELKAEQWAPGAAPGSGTATRKPPTDEELEERCDG